MSRRTAAMIAVCLIGTPAFGQVPPGVTPNFNNRFSQPVSPYLNLLRGGDPAANYFYGVRPAQQAGNYLSLAQAGGLNFGANAGLQRQGFFPYAESFQGLPPRSGGIRPSGHPSTFGNTLGYFGGPSQIPNRPAQATPPPTKGRQRRAMSAPRSRKLRRG